MPTSSPQRWPDRAPNWRPPQWAARLGAAVVLPLVLYLVLRPENYNLTPNNLDPIFYTGYASNLDDMIAALGDRWYFVSRWSAYLPAYVFDELAGTILGRLVWRLVLAASILLVVWELGRRYQRTLTQQLLVGTLVITMPIFVRAFFSDYVEYLVVALGIVLVGLCLRSHQTVATALATGAIAGLIVVANPAAIAMAGLSAATGLVVSVRSWRRRVVHAAATGAAFVAVGLAGLVFFRARYGFDNVYQPTIDFMRNYRAPENDPWRSPQLKWLGEFTWIYVVPIFVVGSVLVARARAITFDRVEKAALILCSLEYATHWYDQFIRGGLTLELPLYWSFTYPTFAIAVVLVTGRLTDGVRAEIVAAMMVAWIALLFAGVPDPLRLPAGAGFAALAVAVCALAAIGGRKAAWLPVVLLVGLVGWTQIGAPVYTPTPDTSMNASPYYDRVFRRGGSHSEQVLAETVWFAKQMDRVPNDERAAFVSAGGWSGSIAGIYAPHVTGRLVPMQAGRERLTDQAIYDIRSGGRPVLAVYGPAPNVERILARFPADLGVGTKVLDETHTKALGYRLVVYQMPDAKQTPFTWRAESLRVETGQLIGSRILANPGDPPGVVGFSPYLNVTPGRYAATIRYSSSEPPGQSLGTFEVYAPHAGLVGSVALEGTASATREVTVEFLADGEGARYEIRALWNGAGTIAVTAISYDRA